MKRQYKKPTLEFIEIKYQDIITSSGQEYKNNHGHGNAWGYNNGNHNGHGKGHNPHDN